MIARTHLGSALVPQGSECADYGVTASLLNPISWFSCLNYDVPYEVTGSSTVATAVSSIGWGPTLILGLGIGAVVLFAIFGSHR